MSDVSAKRKLLGERLQPCVSYISWSFARTYCASRCLPVCAAPVVRPAPAPAPAPAPEQSPAPLPKQVTAVSTIVPPLRSRTCCTLNKACMGLSIYVVPNRAFLFKQRAWQRASTVSNTRRPDIEVTLRNGLSYVARALYMHYWLQWCRRSSPPIRPRVAPRPPLEATRAQVRRHTT